jgi:hypothetical protein
MTVLCVGNATLHDQRRDVNRVRAHLFVEQVAGRRNRGKTLIRQRSRISVCIARFNLKMRARARTSDVMI